MRPRRTLLVLSSAALLSACASAATRPAPVTARPTASGTATAATPPAGSSTGAPASASPAGSPLGACPPPVDASRLTVLVRAGGADDIAVDGSGGLWISRVDAGELLHVDASGAVLARRTGLPAPEGIALLPDGRVALAEQGANRVVTLDGHVVASLPRPPAGALGVDGIGLDAAGTDLLVPDSPHGTLLQVPLAGGPTRMLATGLGRPVDVTPGPDGALYVTAENAAGLLRVPAEGGRAARVGTGLSDLDDIVARGALVYVTALGAHELLAVDPRSGASRVLVTGLPEPQGLAVLPDGRLAVADEQRGAVLAAPSCGS